MLAGIVVPSWAGAQSLSSLLGSAAVTLDPVKVAEVKAGVYGTRFYYDTNTDGKMDECWFIDTDPRHKSANKPMLVKAIDTSGNLAAGIEPSHASAVWIADWNANGTADSAIIYEDYDRDGDLDAMAVYYPPTSSWWWSRDDGDDNLLWFDQDYTYDQTACQDHCHFGGDETFFAVEFNNTTKTFAPRWEAPFFFFDNTLDKRTDEVFRITVQDSSHPSTVLTLRWSFNVNADGTMEDPRRYDCSISAYPVSGMTINGDNATTDTIYGYPATPFLSRPNSRSWARSATWLKGLFTWVENGNNVGWATGGNYAYHEERWEGVIANGAANFTAIGGPTCGPYNNRYELNLAPGGPFEYYYNPADKRIHLKKASQAWLETDWDSSWAGDMKYTWTDTNADGILDHIAFDIDDNGTADDQWDIATNQIQNLSYEWQTFHDVYMPVLTTHMPQLYDLDRSLAAALEAVQAGSSTDAVWTLLDNKFVGANIADWKRAKFVGSDITLLYYLELVRDRWIYKLKTLATGSAYDSFWTSFNAARTTGDTDTMASLLRSQFGPATPDWTSFADYVANLRTPTTQRVDSSSVWLPSGIAWETENAAWRILNGRFDFYGKRTKALKLDNITLSTNLSTDTGGWGMDALDEGTGPGAGGLTLYVNGTAYPLYGTTPAATYSVIEQANDKVTVQMLFNSVGPSGSRTVRVRATAQAGRDDTQLEALITGGPTSDTLELGIGLTRPPEAYYENRPEAGVTGIWGFQSQTIDWVGMGIYYQPGAYSRFLTTSSELDLVLNAQPNQLVNWTIRNDWRRGRRFSVWPSGPDWLNGLSDSAGAVPFPFQGTPVWVDFSYTGIEMGTQEQPYQTLGRGANAVAAGGQVWIKAGVSSETMRITKQMRIESSGGAAIVGRETVGMGSPSLEDRLNRNSAQNWIVYR